MDYPEAPLAVADVDATTTSATAVTETADVPIEVATTTTTVTTATTKAPPKSGRIYHDETLVSFFRRLTFTPDGSLLLAPAGIVRTNASDPAAGMENCVHVYARNAITKYACRVRVFIPLFHSHVAFSFVNNFSTGHPLLAYQATNAPLSSSNAARYVTSHDHARPSSRRSSLCRTAWSLQWARRTRFSSMIRSRCSHLSRFHIFTMRRLRIWHGM